MPVCIVVSNHSSRLEFVLDLIFSRILGLKVILVEDFEQTEDGPTIIYGDVDNADAISIHDCGMLWDEGCFYSPPVVQEKNGLSELFFDDKVDLFSSVFWMVTEYESFRNPTFDSHKRYSLSPTHQKLSLESQPIVHLWVSQLEQQLLAKWPGLSAEQQKPTYPHQITFDLDNPWKYLHKPLWVQVAGLAKATITLRFREVGERFESLLTGNDPNDTLEEIFETCAPEFTTFFILLANLHANDSRFTWRHQRWKKRIREIVSKGYSVGIHPSYLASDIPGQIQKEKTHLEDIIQKHTSRTRMHFLRYKLPTTRQEMIQAGIREDYTSYLNGSGGFPNGMMIPYPWFDLEKNQATELSIVPTILMDRTVVGSPGNPRYEDQVIPTKEFLGLLTTIIDGNGAFVLCLHNECLSESGEWQTWSRWFAEIIRILKEKNAVGRS